MIGPAGPGVHVSESAPNFGKPSPLSARSQILTAQVTQPQPDTMRPQLQQTSSNTLPLGKRKGVQLAPQPVRLKRSRQDRLRAKKSNRSVRPGAVESAAKRVGPDEMGHVQADERVVEWG